VGGCVAGSGQRTGHRRTVQPRQPRRSAHRQPGLGTLTRRSSHLACPFDPGGHRGPIRGTGSMPGLSLSQPVRPVGLIARQSRLGLWRTRRTLPERGRLLIRARRPTWGLLSVCSGTRVRSRSGRCVRQNATSPSPARIEALAHPVRQPRARGSPPVRQNPARRPSACEGERERWGGSHARATTELAAAFLGQGEPRPDPSRPARPPKRS
jgi:hypothetical protein